jgi:uncharacterized delta-60 repeat protein
LRATTLPIDGFNPNPNSIVNAILVQPDGKILVGGYFTQLQPYALPVSGHGYIARLNHDGSPDGTFSPNANGVVRVMALQPNGQILVGGSFTSIQPTGGTTQITRNYVARLNADGTLDSAFNPGVNGIVYAIAVQPNGQIVIGGSFTSVQPNGAASTTTRNRIARFNADGSLDTSFDPNADKPVLAIAVEPNGEIVIGGGFSKLQPNGVSAATTRSCAARLNSDGSLDMGFDPEPNASVSSIAVLPSGQIVIGGEFVTVQPNGATYTTQCDFLARLNADGSLDTNFIINPLDSVTTVVYEPDGKLLIGGTFTQVYPENDLSPSATLYCARINADGSVDETFYPSPNQAVNAIAVQEDGNVLIGGFFTSLQPLDKATATPRMYLARVNSYGVPDSTIAPDDAGTVFTTLTLPNGQYLVGGTFLSIGGVTRSYFARLNADGSLDNTFAVTINGPVQAMALQSDGKILIGGSFSQVDGFSRLNMARLNPDGTLDGPFNPTPNSTVNAILPLSTGQILIGGGFSAFTPNGSTTAFGLNYLARLNSDGSLDLTFNPNPSGGVFAIAQLSDGRLVVAGGFTTIAGYTRSFIARLQANGDIDTNSFDPEANSVVYAVAIQSDGKVIIGGGFNGVQPQTAKAAVATTLRNAPNAPQTVLPAAGVSAYVPIYVNHLARLNTDGTLDTTFFPNPSADVLGVALQGDGGIVVTGIMTSFAPNFSQTGTIRNYIGRVSASGVLDPSFNPNFNALGNTVSVLSNGHIMVGGSFTTVQPNGASTPSFIDNVVVLNPDGTVDPSFALGKNSAMTGQVQAFAEQPNLQVLVAGSFSPIGGSPGSYFSRLNGDGSADTSFNAYVDGTVNTVAVLPNGASTLTPTNSGAWLNANGRVRYAYSAASNGEVVCSAVQADGRIIIGGLFSNFGGVSGLQNLVRLNTDGTVDTTFTPTPTGVVSAIVVQGDGKIVVGGGFTNINSVNNAYIARLNPDGTIDSAFAPQPNLQILCMALQPDGKIVIGGDFTLLVPTNATGGTPSTYAYNYIARVNTDGSIDTTFNPDCSGSVYSIALLPNKQIVVGGAFTSFTPNAGKTTSYVQDLARLNSDGTVDTTFYPDPNAPVSAIAVQSDGKIVVGGTFTIFQQNENVGNLSPAPTVGATVTRYYIARINTDGSVDTTFDPHPNGGLTVVAIQANGQIVFGGNFTGIQPNETGAVAIREDIARVNADGSVDPSFDPSFNGTVDTITPLPDGSLFVGGNFNTVQVGGALLIGGNFSSVGATAAAHLARLNADSTLDSSFLAHPDGPVNALVPLLNGTVLVGGAFANIDGVPRANLVRINTDSSIDTSFNPAVNGAVNTIALEPNGQVLIGGAFTSAGGPNSAYLARLGPTGSPDGSFAPAVNGIVNAIAIQPNGQIVIAGSFTSVDGAAVSNLARLNGDGSLDATFNPAPNGTVLSLAQVLDGTFYVAGLFTSIGGQPLPYAAHIESSGAADPSFTPNVNAPVSAVLVQPDGKILIGGAFTTVGGLSRVGIARFSAPTPVTQSVSVSADQSTYTWTRSGDAPVFSSVFFEETTDGTHWTTAGQASTSDGATWQLIGASPTGAALFYVRATGLTPSSEFSSSGLTQVFYLANSTPPPLITSASSVTGTSGQPFLFVVTATRSPQTYTATGLPPGLTINSTTGVISGTPTAVGTYKVAVTANGTGGLASSTMTITIGAASGTPFVPASTSLDNRLLNLSTRVNLAGSQVLVAGFAISGTAPKTVLVRAVGPGLTEFDVPGVMKTPELQLYSSSGSVIAQNTGWGSSPAIAATITQVGAFSLAPGSADSAIVASLGPGTYTAQVFDPSGTGGIVLLELYDADASPMTSPQRLTNISAMGAVTPTTGALFGGFVISGSSTKSILIRGIGPGLSAFKIAAVLPDPVLSVFDSGGNLVAQNFSWTSQSATGPDQPAITAADITAADTSVGAFALSALNSDTALIANLAPGAYTFEISSASGRTGVVLGEVYELP